MKGQRYSTFPMETINTSTFLFSKQVTQTTKMTPGLIPRRAELQVADRRCSPVLCPHQTWQMNPKVLREAALQAQRQVGGEVLQQVSLPARLVCHLQRTHTPCD